VLPSGIELVAAKPLPAAGGFDLVIVSTLPPADMLLADNVSTGGSAAERPPRAGSGIMARQVRMGA
jgi:hypothetical protein